MPINEDEWDRGTFSKEEWENHNDFDWKKENYYKLILSHLEKYKHKAFLLVELFDLLPDSVSHLSVFYDWSPIGLEAENVKLKRDTREIERVMSKLIDDGKVKSKVIEIEGTYVAAKSTYYILK